MVGIMATSSKERVACLLNSARWAPDIHSKLDYVYEMKHDLFEEDDPALFSELLPLLFQLQSDRFSPVRKFVTEIVGDIGVKNLELLPEIVPVLIHVLEDATPAVARQAITCGIDLFSRTLKKITIQGLYNSELDEITESSWSCMLTFKDKVYSIVSRKSGSDGLIMLALKFVERIILLYTPDPNGSSEPPLSQSFEENPVEFNVSWLHGGHPVLKIADLSVEASKSLGLLLDQLRFPAIKSLSNLMIIVLIKSLSSIAEKRPAFYGRILPVLLGLDPSSSVIKGVHISATHHALKKAFLSCLKCTHPSAAPWRDRLIGGLRGLKAGGLTEEVLQGVYHITGLVVEEKDDFPVIKEEKPSIKTSDAANSNTGRKRSVTRDSIDMAEDNDTSVKRARSMACVSEESMKELNTTSSPFSQDAVPSVGQTTSKPDVETGPVQQLVAMFGALVAQGEKAVGSLEILISSISADLLAELVMANMRFLPQTPPKAEGDQSLVDMNIVGSDTVRYPPSFLDNVLSLSSSFPRIASLLDTDRSMFDDMVKPQGDADEENGAVMPVPGIDDAAENESLSTGLPASFDAIPSVMDEGGVAIPPDVLDENMDSEIPGLDSSARVDVFPETHIDSSLVSTDLEEASQDQVTSSSKRSPHDSLPSISADRSEELSSKAIVTDAHSLVSSTATSVRMLYSFVLPKMSAPVVNLTDEEKDHLQKMAFKRIVEAYKQIAVAGGSQIRSSLLAYLGVEFPLELDPWKVLQKHIVSDYTSLEGHDLTLQVLYRLFGEAEEDSDFFSSTNATSVYEMFLLTVAETIKDSFPPSDKSLSRLLGEAPYLPQSVLKLLECLCSPGNHDKAEEQQGGDRVTQGLSTVWSLILLRPPTRDICLKIALKSAVHHSEEVRMKAIRLVANKLYPLPSIAHKIEDFAKEMLLSVMTGDASERTHTEELPFESQKGSDLDKLSNEQPSGSAISKDANTDTHESGTSQSISSHSISEAQRCMSLYFALCTKKHSLFREIFVFYKCTSVAVEQAVHGHIPILVRTMGSSPELLDIISDPPSGSEKLLMQVVHTLTDGKIPSTELILAIRKLYDSKLKDVEILIPILPFLPKDEVLVLFPGLVSLPTDRFQAVLTRTLQGSSRSGPVLTPAEVLIAIHGIDPDKDGIPLKKVTDACNACFEQRQTFTQQVLAKVLNQLVEQIPLPLLFMRTVLQSIGAFPGLVEFIMEILSRLVSKQIWKYPKLWVGFLKCAQLTKPQSFSVLLQLPPAQLANALSKIPALKEPLVAHATQENIQSSLPRSLLIVLGIVQDSNTSSQPQISQAQTAETSTSDKETQTEKSKESSTCS